MYPEIYNPSKTQHTAQGKTPIFLDSFKCKRCGLIVFTQPAVSGVQNRNHCPYCLCSRHVDHYHPGDRLSACKAVMEPIGLTVKPGRNKYGRMSFGELMIIHRCGECGKLSLNRLAADDLVERLLDIYYESLAMDGITLDTLSQAGIRLLNRKDWCLVARQLQGIEQI